MAIDERELDDAMLVEAAQDGDSEAFAELFRRHYPSVRRVCARRMGNAGDADEVAQAAFVRAYERIEQCGGERRFGAWVQVIAYRLGADARRLQARAVPMDEPEQRPGSFQANSCEDALLLAEQSAAVHNALATLPLRQRQVIIARDLEGQRPGEIAASLGVSLGAVDSLLLRARRRMAVAWKAASIEHGTTVPATSFTAAATAAAAGRQPGAPAQWAGVAGRAIDRWSWQLAQSLRMVPGASPLATWAASLAVAGAILAAPVAAGVPSPLAPSGAPASVAVARPVGALVTAPQVPLSDPALVPAPPVVLPAAPTLVATRPSLPALSTPTLSAPTLTTPTVAVPPTMTATGLVTNTAATVTATINKAVAPVLPTVNQTVATVLGTINQTVRPLTQP